MCGGLLAVGFPCAHAFSCRLVPGQQSGRELRAMFLRQPWAGWRSARRPLRARTPPLSTDPPIRARGSRVASRRRVPGKPAVADGGAFRRRRWARTGNTMLYAATNVESAAMTSIERPRLTGQGTYRVRRSGEPAQQLQLDLQTGDARSPKIITADWSRSAWSLRHRSDRLDQRWRCFDTVIHVAAQPAIRAGVCRLGKDGVWRQDCLGGAPCAGRAAPIAGTFLLHHQASNPPYDTYAITDVDWLVQAADGPRRITGSGTYQIGGGGFLMQQLQLDLRTNAGPVEHFDSGILAGGTEFPAIDIEIGFNDQVCISTVIQVTAKPMGDFNLDGFVDAADFAWFQACLTSPGQPHPDPACRAADLDEDGDVDHADFAIFQRCITAAGERIDPACAQ